MSSTRVSLLLVGVGGQGVLTTAQILGNAAHAAGLPVRVGQLHGMSQRGGSIECTVLFGPGHSTFLGAGEADLVLAFEPLEGLRAVPRMHAGTRVLLNVDAIVPFELIRSGRAYPPLSDVVADISAVCSEVYTVIGSELVRESGADRTLNAVLLGAAAALGFLPFADAVLEEALVLRCGQAFAKSNLRALDLGRNTGRSLQAPLKEGHA